MTSDLQIANPQVNVDIDRDRRPARRQRRADRERAVRRVRLAAGVDDLHADQPVPGDPGGAAGVPARPRRARTCSTCARPTGDLVPLERGRHVDRRRRAADGQPLGPAAGGDALVQPRAGRVARATAIGDGRGGGPRRNFPPTMTTGFPGHGAGVPVVAQQGCGLLLVARGGRDLPGARHAVRELHPPGHDPVRAAVRRRSARC